MEEQNDVGRELRSLNNLIHRQVDRTAGKQSLENATGTNGWIIGFLAANSHRDIYQKDLEQEFTITRSTASKVISLMERKGLIRRESVPHDARLKKLTLTDKAKELTAIMRQDMKHLESKLLQGFSQEEVAQLHSYIQRMKENVRD